MKVILKKTQVNSILTEIAGVPLAAEFWVKVIGEMATDAITNLINDNGPWGDVEVHTTVGETDADQKGIIIQGRDIQELAFKMGYDINSKKFKDFPLVEPSLNLSLIIVPDDLIDVKDFIAAGRLEIDLESKELVVDKEKRDVFTGGDFYFDIMVPKTIFEENKTLEFFKEEVKPRLESVVFHELTHAYEHLQRKLTGSETPGLESAWNRIAMSSKVGVPDWDELMHLIYLHLSFELNARVAEMYQKLKSSGITSAAQFKKLLETSRIWDYAKQLSEFNTEKFLENFVVPEWVVANVRKDAGKELPYEEVKEEVLQDLIKNWAAWYEAVVKDYEDIVEVPDAMQVKNGKENKTHRIPPLNKNITSSPKNFVKFWEKRFNRKGDDSKKKLYRLYNFFSPK